MHGSEARTVILAWFSQNKPVLTSEGVIWNKYMVCLVLKNDQKQDILFCENSISLGPVDVYMPTKFLIS